MNTLFAIFFANRWTEVHIANCLSLFLRISARTQCNEYFFLAIPFFAVRGIESSTTVRKKLHAGLARDVGEVPHDVRKVAFPRRVDFRKVTLVNSLF
jgi:hypothetical protein